MKLFRSITLALCMLLSSYALPQAKLPEPQPQEFNLGFCGGTSFTVVHAVLSPDGKSLQFTHHLSDPATVVKDEGKELLTWSVKLEPKGADGNQKYSASAKYDDVTLTIDGLIRGNRIIGLQKVDGDLGHVLYGVVGKVDDMVKDVSDDISFCADVHMVGGEEDIPKLLIQWLTNAAKED